MFGFPKSGFIRPAISAALAAALVSAILISPASAQPNRGGQQRQMRPEPNPPAPPSQSGAPASAEAAASAVPLPADKTTQHMIRIAGRDIAFTATAGTIPLFNEQTRAVTARIGYIAFIRSEQNALARPVTFAWNGGPGYASAWLNLGAMGPWRLDMEGAAARPSAPPATSDNGESWLEFTDLVFLDPPGTGFGQVAGGDDASRALWSVNGDIAALSTAIRRWVIDNGRIASPRYLAGESYGGFRAPKIARRLQTVEGLGVNGMILVSPVLDFARYRAGGLLTHVARLPSYAATHLSKSRAINRADLNGTEIYAQGEYLSDLMKGLKDSAALARLTENVTKLTGLDKTLVSRYGGRVPMHIFTREIHRAEGRIASQYDGAETGLDPNPFTQSNEAEDQLLRGLHAPITSAMLDIYQNRLQWMAPDGRYRFQNEAAGRQWDWGDRMQQATGDLAAALALDSSMRVLVTHGLADLITPYFETKMVLDQMPQIGDPARIKFQVYPGGHMFYAREAARKSFRDDARAMMSGNVKPPADL